MGVVLRGSGNDIQKYGDDISLPALLKVTMEYQS